MRKPLPSEIELKEYFDYDSKSGHLLRKKKTGGSKGGRGTIGEPVGVIWTNPSSNKKYWAVKFKYKRYMLHRLIWAWHGYSVPDDDTHEIDHINGNSLDNRIENLRVGSNKQNQENRKVNVNNKTGVKGVQFIPKTKKYIAVIHHNKKNLHLGTYSTLEEAVSVRKEAERKYYTFI